MRATLTASGALAAVSMPVTITLYPPAAIPLVALGVVVTAIAVWHLSRGRRITVRRTAKGNLTVVFDTTPKRPVRGVR